MKPKYRPLDAEPTPSVLVPPALPPTALRPTALDLPVPPEPAENPLRPPLPPPGSSRDRREERIRKFWESRDRAERPPPVPAGDG